MVLRIKTINGSEHSEEWMKHIRSKKLLPEQELILIRKSNLPWLEKHSLFIQTQFWRRLRIQVMERDDFACVVCGGRVNVHVDHLCYPGFGNETLDDLQTLCYFCHAKKTQRVDMRARTPIVEVSVVANKTTQLFTLLRRKHGSKK